MLAKGLGIHKDKQAPQVIYNLVPRVTRNRKFSFATTISFSKTL